MEIIKTTNLTKSYGKSRGIIDVNLSVNEGEVFGFIGPNGAGKSTTIRTLLGLITATSGSAEVFGRNINNKTKILADTGYMSSEAMFYNGMRAKEVILLSANLRKKDCSEEAKKLCERFMLDTEKRVEELSLGNRKKLAIICAMQHKPKLYILDEPTSGLDPLMQKEFFHLLKERNDEGATVFLSSHVLAEIQRNCSRAAIIKDGRIVALDSVENFSKSNAKKISLHGVTNLPEQLNAKSVSVVGDSVNFLYQGDIKNLLNQISNLSFYDMAITEPDLEEIFMHYYEKDGE